MEYILKADQLTKKYFTKVALDHVSFNFERGKIYGLLGPNGSGKTTLMKVFAGLHKQTSGEILVKEMPISYKTKRDVVFMPTEDFLYPWMKVKFIIKYYKDMYSDFDILKAQSLVKKLDLNMENKVSELSTGLKGRLKVALAIARDTSVYMFDEPLNGLDPISREMVLNVITDIINEDNVIIVSSHLVSELETCLDEVIFLKNGLIELQGDAEKIRCEKGKSIEELYKEVYKNV